MPPHIQERQRFSSLPFETTSFIGRTAEIAEITALLSEPACRLLTLLGPGGIGKSRLAIQVAANLTEMFSPGVFFIPLQSVQTPQALISAIADGLNFPLSGQEDTATQLLKYLRGKELLLLLDNFEQLIIQGGESKIADMLEAVPEIKILVTSREVLNLQGEWIYAIKGLSLPGKGPTDRPADSDAVQLFSERASQVQQHFSLETEIDHVVHIARLVEGVPLALELAASWSKLLPSQAIAEEIASNLDFLSTQYKDLPVRHQSIRFIFDQTWSQLSQVERDVFKRLSVFRGGFQREAAEQVAGATLPLLSALQDKALLQWRANGRYHIHELLRQYATEQLAESQVDLAQVRESHCTYYVEFLNQCEIDLMGQRQVAATGEIEAELENINAAWQFALEQANVTQIQKAAFALGNFYQFQSRYAEGLQAFEQASTQIMNHSLLEQANLALIDTLMVCSWFYLRFGQADKIESVMKQSLQIHRELGIDPKPGYITDPLIMLAFSELIRGNYVAATTHAEQSCLTNERLNHNGNLKFAYFLLSQAAMAQGDKDTARHFAEKAFMIVQAMEDSWFMAYVLNALADMDLMEQKYSIAQKHYEKSYAIRQAFNDAEGMAVALNRLSEIALQQHHYEEARGYYKKSLDLYQEINDTGGIATSYYGLGHTAVIQNDYHAAGHYYAQGLQLAADIRYVPLILTLLVGIGELFCWVGQVKKGIPLFVFVQHHSSTDQETKGRAGQLLRSFKLHVKPQEMESLISHGQSGRIEGVIDTSLATLSLLDLAPAASAPITALADDPNQRLVEPLTGRELDVLVHLAEGFSNKEIAERLVIAEGTVKYYTRQIYGKLQVKNRTQAVNQAQELGLV